MTHPAGEYEQQVAESIHIREGPGAELFFTREAQNISFGPPTDGAGLVQEATHFPTAGQDKRVKGLQIFLTGIDNTFEALDLRLADSKHAFVGKVCGGGQFTPEVEQFILELAENIVQVFGGRQLWLQVVIEYPSQTYNRVQFVQRPIGLDTGSILRGLLTPDEPGRTLITRPSINLCNPDHCVSGLWDYPIILTIL